MNPFQHLCLAVGGMLTFAAGVLFGLWLVAVGCLVWSVSFPPLSEIVVIIPAEEAKPETVHGFRLPPMFPFPSKPDPE